MSSPPAKQTMEVIKAVGQQLHVLITPLYKLAHVNHVASFLPISRKEVHVPSTAAASSKTSLIQYPVSLLRLQPFLVTWLFSLRIQTCFDYSHF